MERQGALTGTGLVVHAWGGRSRLSVCESLEAAQLVRVLWGGGSKLLIMCGKCAV